jgi:phosphatidylethanolamine/phosphatidyl-N-methylethanolamine N-methyltransferase
MQPADKFALRRSQLTEDLSMSDRLAIDLQLPKGSRGGKPPRPQKVRRAKTPSTSGRLKFLSAFLREPFKVGAFWPSSLELSRKIVEGCELHQRDTVVELGPGTGAFTSLILERVRRQARFFALELSATNVRELRRRFPRLDVYADSAEKLPAYLEMKETAKADCIISGLAWGNMLPATQNRIFDAVVSSLAPGGLFTTFAYVHAKWLPTSLRFRQRLFRHFSRIEVTPIVWRNLPPAFIYRCWNE